MKKNYIVNLQAYSLFNQNSDTPIGGVENDLYLLSKYFNLHNFYVDVVIGDWGQSDVECYGKIRFLHMLPFQLIADFFPYFYEHSLFKLFVARDLYVELKVIKK